MTKYTYHFINAGAIVDDNAENSLLHKKTNRIFVDVGGRWEPGIIDSHAYTQQKDTDMSSTASLIVKHKEYILSHTLEYLRIPSGMENDRSIEIVMHHEPDLDCFVSVYLIQELIETGRFPEGTGQLVDYVNQNCSGKILIGENSVRTMLAAIYVIPAVLKAINAGTEPIINTMEKYPENKDDVDKCVMFIRDTYFKNHRQNQKIIDSSLESAKNIAPEESEIVERGLEFVRYGVASLQKILATERSKGERKESTQNMFLSDGLFEGKTPFEWEFAVVAEDFRQYERDLADPLICEKTVVELPAREENQKLIKVDALFWNKPPRCMFVHKHLARQDTRNSKLGRGFTFTFIPEYPRENTKVKGMRVECNRVFISVDGNSNVNLRGLGKVLELAERQKENCVFDSNSLLIGQWRSRHKARWAVDWCDNQDPWYDGSEGHHDYTIVVSPTTGSLMKISEIKRCVFRYLRPVVYGNHIRFVFPFSLPSGLFGEQKCDQTQTCVPFVHGENNLKSLERNQKQYFLKYIRDYLYCDKKANKIPYVKYLEISIADEWNAGLCAQSASKAVPTNACLTVFRYGVGLVTIDYQVRTGTQEEDLLFDDVLNLCSDMYINFHEQTINPVLTPVKVLQPIWKQLCCHFYKEECKSEPVNEITFDSCLVFVGLQISSEIHYNSKNRELAYRLCTCVRPEEPVEKDIYQTFEHKYFLRTQDQIQGFTKNGGCQLSLIRSGEAAINAVQPSNQVALLENFFTKDFDIFVLGLHQRDILLNFSHDLSLFDNEGDKSRIAKLRQEFMNFTTQSWFSQITTDEMGMEKFRKWQRIFETRLLYGEVNDQLGAVNDYYNNRVKDKYEDLTRKLVPIFLGGTITSVMTRLLETNLELLAVIGVGWAALFYGWNIYLDSLDEQFKTKIKR